MLPAGDIGRWRIVHHEHSVKGLRSEAVRHWRRARGLKSEVWSLKRKAEGTFYMRLRRGMKLLTAGASLARGQRSGADHASLAQGSWFEVGSLESEEEIGRSFYILDSPCMNGFIYFFCSSGKRDHWHLLLPCLGKASDFIISARWANVCVQTRDRMMPLHKARPTRGGGSTSGCFLLC